MATDLNLTGELVEIGRVEDGLNGFVICRADGSFVTIKGLSEDEVRSAADCFMQQVMIAIAKASA